MIGDFYGDKWRQHEWYPAAPTQHINLGIISRAEFDALKKEVQDLKELLKRAKEYDAKNGEPDCEIEPKIALLRKVAEAVGVSLEEVLKPPNAPAVP